MFDIFDLFISLYPHILIFLGSCALTCTLACSHHYILMFVCTCLYPRILTSSYLQVHVPSLALLHLHILRFVCILACNLVSSHPLSLRLMHSGCLLVSSHPYILISLGSCTPVLVGILVSSHPHILRFMYPGCLLVFSYPPILIPLGSCTPGACWYPRILTSSYP